MVIAIITATKAEELKGLIFENEMLYNPGQLIDGSWYVSLPEAQYLSASEIYKLIDFVPIEIDESEM